MKFLSALYLKAGSISLTTRIKGPKVKAAKKYTKHRVKAISIYKKEKKKRNRPKNKIDRPAVAVAIMNDQDNNNNKNT